MSALISAAGRTATATVAKATSAASVTESASGRSATAAIAKAASSATETASSSSTSGLGAKNGRFAASGTATTRLGLEHWRVFQHVRKNEESNFGTTDIDVLQLRDSSVAVSDRVVLHLEIHVVFGLDQFASIDFPGGRLHRDDVPLRLVEDFNGYSDRDRHL